MNESAVLKEKDSCSLGGLSDSCSLRSFNMSVVPVVYWFIQLHLF
jgi:hypothetical protein